MSGSNRSHFFAIVAGLGIAFGLGAMVTSLDYRGDYQERYPSYSDARKNAESATASAQSGVGTPSPKIPCVSPQSREESDLCAQWRAANGAKQAARWGLWQLVISIFGVMGLGATLWFNKRAIDLALESGEDTERALAISERNANAAADQVRVAEDTAKRQLRAYVSPSAAWLEIDQNTWNVVANVHARNFGQTPASNERHWVSIWVECFPLHGPLPDPEHPVQMGSAVIGPGGHTEMRHARPNPLNEASRARIIDGTAAIYVFGQITYEDIYEAPHTSRYIFFCSGAEAFERGVLASYMTGNTCE